MSSQFPDRPPAPGSGPGPAPRAPRAPRAVRAVRSAAPAATAGSVFARVVKRDGREVPFDRTKVRAAVARAQAAVGEDDPQFAEEVAAVVTLTLEQRHEARARLAERGREPAPAEAAAPHIEEIQDLVEHALIGMGRAAVAKAYILYRDRRAQVRDVLRVRARSDGSPPRVHEGDRSAPWSKGRIVASLLAEADLPRSTAEEVAARVEERVLTSGLRRLSTGLIRELVAGELVDLGLTVALRSQSTVGLPRHDLRRVLAGVPLQRWESALEPGTSASAAVGESPTGRRAPVESVVAREVMRRYGLDEIFGEATVERHLSGELSIEDLGAPHLPLTAAVPAELLLTGEPGPGAAFESIEALVDAALHTSWGVVLEDPGYALLPLVRATRAGSPMGLAAWLRAVSAAARGAGRALDLGSPGMRFPAFTARLVEALASLPSGSAAPRLFLRDAELVELVSSHPGLAETVDDLVRRGRLVLTWGRDDVRFAGPGCHRHARERAAIACGGAVALNLPRAARAAGAWREELFLEELAGLVQCAVAACRELDVFQRAHPGARPGAPSARVGFAIVPIGLREALAFLGGGEIDLAQGSRIVGFLAEAARRFSAGEGPEVVLDAFFGRRAAARLAHLDGERARGEGAEQPWLFDDAALPRPDRAYTRGFALSPVPGFGVGAAEAELLTTVPSGALHPAPRSRPDGSDHPRLSACERFFALRPGDVEAGRALLFPGAAPARPARRPAADPARDDWIPRRGPRGLLRPDDPPGGPAAGPARLAPVRGRPADDLPDPPERP